MSYDRKLDQVCPHVVTEEALFFNSDRLSVRPLRPIASSGSVRVRVDGAMQVPASGYHLPAKAKTVLPGPFNVKEGVNDLLIVSVDNGPDITLTAPPGKLPAKELARALSKQSPLFFTTSKKDQIVVHSSVLGTMARFIFKPGSTLAPLLGLTINKLYRGQQVFPPWALVTDPNTLADRPTRLIVFGEPINGTNDYVEINYNTIRQECRRCGGTGVENDFRYDRSGKVIKIRDADLLSQEVLKITYTVKGSNPFHLWYGTSLLEAIGKKLSDRGLVQNLIMSDLQDSFRRWQSIKRQQEEDVGQFVSDEEYPFRLSVVNIEPSDDPTVILVNAFVQNRSNNPIQISRGLKLPVPFDLLGSTTQEALLREQQIRALTG